LRLSDFREDALFPDKLQPQAQDFFATIPDAEPRGRVRDLFATPVPLDALLALPLVSMTPYERERAMSASEKKEEEEVVVL